MRVLFDQGTPAPLRHSLAEHLVETAFELGWAKLKNGELISLAEEAGFAVFVTTDRNLKYQQNLAARSLSIVVLTFYKLASHPTCNAGSRCRYQRRHSGWLRGGSRRLKG
jgi:hypothetical protein